MLWIWMMSVGLPFPFLALRAETIHRRMMQIPLRPIRPSRLPSVSIIIPARNEEHNLRHLLPSLAALDYPGELEIILVNDNSTDRTVDIATSFPVKVVNAGPLPESWYGKPYACQKGAAAATGDWLLFTDADTIHSPFGLSAAVQHALDQDLDGLSLFLAEETFGITDKLALMTAFAGLFAGMHGGHQMMNGQYILISRGAYEASGGFTSVRREAVEDLALAHRLHEFGFIVPTFHGQNIASVQMYRDVQNLWLGLSRISSGALKWSGAGSWLSALFITGALLPLVAIPLVLFAEMPASWLGATWLMVLLAFVPWARRSGNVFYAVLAPFGALFVQLAALTGLLRSALGSGVNWKGRKV